MKILTRAICDPQKLTGMEGDLTLFLNEQSKNPFMLYPFIKNTLSIIPDDSTPIFLVSKVGSKTVGFASLLIRHQFGVRTVSFLLKSELSPDFIIEERYREDVVRQFLKIISGKLHCKSMSLVFPEDSPNLEILRNLPSKQGEYRIKHAKQSTHSILFLKHSTWDEFQKFKGSRFRKKFRTIERDLAKNGEWEIKCFREGMLDPQAVDDLKNRIFSIENQSWKQAWRLNAGQVIDEDLQFLMESTLKMQTVDSNFACNFWFLEINQQPVAYCIIVQYKGTAYITKTSYVDRFKPLHIGYFIMNAAIKDMFDNKSLKKIDFMTDLYFMKTWTSNYAYRDSVFVRNGAIADVFERTIQQVNKIHQAIARKTQY